MIARMIAIRLLGRMASAAHRSGRPQGSARAIMPTEDRCAPLLVEGQAMTAVAAAAPHRIIRAPRGPERTCKGWIQEAALRMLMNNLDPEVAEAPDRLVVYGGSGKAARTWA